MTEIDIKAEIDNVIDGLGPKLREFNSKIWSNPELGGQEFIAVETFTAFLESLGYSVKQQAYGVRTAFEVLCGSGGRLINFNAEYDCLPVIKHACGHNLIATSSLTAFVALAETVKKLGIEGRVQLLGTPDEEGKGGKITLIEKGAYEGVDVSLMAHPMSQWMYDSTDGPLDGIAGMGMVGRTFIGASYRGKNAHAGGNPWNGINALDAAVAAYNNISLLRQQIAPNDRIHNVLIESENTVNIIPAYAKAAYQTRSPELDDMKNLTERVCNCIKAASLATGTELELHKEAPYEPILMNPTLCEVYTKAGKENGHNVLKSTPKILTGSTDQGNVSQILPSLHSVFTIHGEKGANPHTALFYQAAGTDDAHNRAIVVGKTLARVGYEILTNDEAYKNVRAEWEAQKKEQAQSGDR